MTARIYSPGKNAMQSGRGRTGRWILEFEPVRAPGIEPLMGWTTSADTQRQVRLTFDSAEAAVAYAERNGIAYEIDRAHERAPRPKSYAENFPANRPFLWTH